MKIISLENTVLAPLTRVSIAGYSNISTESRMLVISEEDLLRQTLFLDIKAFTFDIVLIPESMRDLVESDIEFKRYLYPQIRTGGSVQYF